MRQPQTQGGNRKKSRPKHVPQRTCVACRQKGDKRGLIRIVRSSDGTVAIDPTGKRNGRGAYLCDRTGCWQRALDTSSLARALNTDITDETHRSFKEYAATLADGESSEDVVMTS